MEATYLDIALFGLLLNVIMTIFIITVTVFTLIKQTLRGNFEISIWTDKIHSRAAELKDRRKAKSFLIRNEGWIIYLIPYSGLLKTFLLMHGISKYTFVGYIERELQREESLLDELDKKGK